MIKGFLFHTLAVIAVLFTLVYFLTIQLIIISIVFGIRVVNYATSGNEWEAYNRMRRG